MQEQDVAAREIACYAVEDDVCIGFDGVESTTRPARKQQIESRQLWGEERIAQSGRRAKEARSLAGHGRNDVLCAHDLRRDGLRAQQREVVRVAERMVLDRVSAIVDLARQPAKTLDALADAEESRLGGVGIELPRMSSTRGVVSGSGPSSIESATAPRAAASRGSRVQFGPSSELRGQRPAAVMTA